MHANDTESLPRLNKGGRHSLFTTRTVTTTIISNPKPASINPTSLSDQLGEGEFSIGAGAIVCILLLVTTISTEQTEL